MNKLMTFYRKFSRAFFAGSLVIISLISNLPMHAQIPQNIEVDGEAEKGWQYLLYIVALLVVVAVIFLILRIVKKSRKSD